MTLENAVRALAGTMVLVSLGLGYFLHPGFLLLTAFVGANLLQSAFTGLCPAEAIFRRLGLRHAGQVR
jgi:Inner membrane protein YgaP-like, transmembrane domain